MNNVWLIAKRELASYFKTPSGYLIAGLALLVQGLLFNAYAVGSRASYSTEVLQRHLVVAGFITLISAVLLSMRLLAEERAAGVHVLLFTSPIREGELVLGKYLSAVVFLSVMTLLSLYLPALIFINGKVSYGHIAIGYFGLVLLGASTLAIGTFASSLVKQPFFAVLLTAAFAALLEIGWWVAKITEESSFSSVLRFFAPYYEHFQTFRRGLLQLSDLVFFGSIIYLSLVAATWVLKSQRWR